MRPHRSLNTPTHIIRDLGAASTSLNLATLEEYMIDYAAIHGDATGWGREMGEGEGRGFIIRDRRARGEERGASQREAGNAGSTAAGGAGPALEQDQGPAAPVSFSSFVFSLGTSALMLMGEQLSPQEEKLPVNLARAKEMIDILSVLESKTKGNLTSDEQSVLQDMLYALRMKYVDLASGKRTISSS